MYLQKWDKARRAIAEANSVDELATIIDMAEAYRYALKQAKEGTEVVNQATEIKLRAERKAGSFLKDMSKAKGGEQYHQSPSSTSARNPSLSDLGITKDKSSKWQKLAAIQDVMYQTPYNEANFM